jgi:hypothetical protein
MNPRVKDYRYFGVQSHTYPYSVTILVELARKMDQLGRKSQWWMKGGKERMLATNIYRRATQIAYMIYGHSSLEYAKLLREFAKHLEERHQEKGRPEYSRWNKSGMILEDALSDEARINLREAFEVYEINGMSMSTQVADI